MAALAAKGLLPGKDITRHISFFSYSSGMYISGLLNVSRTEIREWVYEYHLEDQICILYLNFFIGIGIQATVQRVLGKPGSLDW